MSEIVTKGETTSKDKAEHKALAFQMAGIIGDLDQSELDTIVATMQTNLASSPNVAAVTARVIAEMQPFIDTCKATSAAIFLQEMSLDELRSAVAFFTSDVGKKWFKTYERISAAQEQMAASQSDYVMRDDGAHVPGAEA